MSTENNGVDLDTLIQTKIEEDTEFQTSLSDLNDEERESAVEARRNEVLKEIAISSVKNEELAKNYKTRAEKAEAERKEKKETTDSLDIKDTIYLGKADIHDDDLDEVLTYAKNMKVSVREAHEHYKPILADRNDERRTAQATQTKSPRGITKNSGEDTLRKAESTGEVPESEKEMEAMLQARLERRRQST